MYKKTQDQLQLQQQKIADKYSETMRIETEKIERITSLGLMIADIEEKCRQIVCNRNNTRHDMESKIKRGESYENERIAYNALVMLDIETDRIRMKHVMERHHLQKNNVRVV